MAQAANQPEARSPNEHCHWLPPRRMRQYQWAKVGTSLLMSAILIGWMILQWESVLSRVVTAALLLLTVLIVTASIMSDLHRVQGRQLSIVDKQLWMTRPDGSAHVAMTQIASAQWVQEPPVQAGLWLYDGQSHPLLHIDTAFLANEAEAREFVGWARRLTGFALDTRWPATT